MTWAPGGPVRTEFLANVTAMLVSAPRRAQTGQPMSFELDAARLPDVATRQRLRDVKSLEFVKWAAGFGEAHGDRSRANESFIHRYPRSIGTPYAKQEIELLRANDVELLRKAAVPVGTTTDPNYAGNLVSGGGIDALLAAFTELVAAQSLLGRIVGARKIPFNARAPFETAGATYSWVAEGAPKPVSTMGFGAGVVLKPTKSASLLVFTQELIRGINDQTADGLRRTLVGGLVAFSDGWLLSTNAATALNPAGILAGVTGITNSGNLATDLATLVAQFFAARPWAAAATFIASPANAHAMAATATGFNSSGVPLPVLVSPAAGGNIILVDGDALVYADAGITFDIATEGTVQMNDAPGTPDATTVFTSLWQQNLVGFKVERMANWAIAPGAVQYLLPAA